jgi:hypothetical protein|nr:MAG TPA: hypothetical protein [Caudoviricetes sp.]
MIRKLFSEFLSTKEEKDQVAAIAMDALIDPIKNDPKPAADCLFDLFTGVANDLVTSK